MNLGLFSCWSSSYQSLYQSNHNCSVYSLHHLYRFFFTRWLLVLQRSRSTTENTRKLKLVKLLSERMMLPGNGYRGREIFKPSVSVRSDDWPSIMQNWKMQQILSKSCLLTVQCRARHAPNDKYSQPAEGCHHRPDSRLWYWYPPCINWQQSWEATAYEQDNRRYPRMCPWFLPPLWQLLDGTRS